MTLCGVDVAQSHDFLPMHGRRIGLITNHTGLNRDGKATADLLRHAPGVQLLTLFSPEHGIRGTADENVGDSIDPATHLPVFSLYGSHRQPTAEQMEDLNCLVFDIQDIGTRFYTYISTLGLCMEAAAKRRMHFIVLDRPNPIGGTDIEGPLPDADQRGFTCYHSLPVRHGMTTGELAKLFNAEKHLNLDLEVIKVADWKRAELWDATHLHWVNPSPNIRSLTQALLYPGIGLLEGTNLSVGRGTDAPFERIGAPWIDGAQLAAALDRRQVPGVRFTALRFTPASSNYAGQECGGVQMAVTARDRFVPVFTGLVIAETLRRLHPQAWEKSKFNALLFNTPAFKAFLNGATAEDLVRSWQTDIAAFRARRRPYLLYD